MRKAALLVLLAAAIRQSSFAQESSYGHCEDKIIDLYKDKPVVELPARRRTAVIRSLLPLLRADANASGYLPEDLTPISLNRLLHYTPLPGGTREEHLLAVRFTLNSACGAHNNCPTYLLGVGAKTARNLMTGPAMAGTGSWGVAVLDSGDKRYPDLAFLAHVSAFETAVACLASDGQHYIKRCHQPCVDLLSHPPAGQ